MEKFQVIDFDSGCGGFSKGLEDSNFFEVVYNGSINKKNELCYNNIHKNSFSILDTPPSKIDLAVFIPPISHKIIDSNNFLKIVNNFLAFITLHDIENLIFITNRNIIPYLHISDKIFYTNDDLPTRDIISCKLIELNYNLYNFILDGAGFGLPQHQFYNIYWASKSTDKNILIKNGFGFYKRPYRKVKNVLKDIDDNTKLPWHIPNYNYRKYCSLVKKGGRLDLENKIGYIRLDENKIAPSLSYNFYTPSSSGPSIHPLFDRPLTIREGARLFGLSDDFIWHYKLSNLDVGVMIKNSFPPLISKLLANKIRKYL